jgi:Flp pilus assembly protein TadG
MVRLIALLRRLRLDVGGVAAVEFAYILPLMLAMYFGANEFGSALTAYRKVTHATSSVADLVAQSKSVTQSDIDNIMDGASAILQPYDKSHLRARISVVKLDSNSKATIEWSKVSNFGQTTGTAKEPLITAYTANQVVTSMLPSGVKQASTYLVMAEIHYYYTPTVGYLISGTLDLNDTFYLRPRQSTSVTGP